jgi:hypothetical protein
VRADDGLGRRHLDPVTHLVTHSIDYRRARRLDVDLPFARSE